MAPGILTVRSPLPMLSVEEGTQTEVFSNEVPAISRQLPSNSARVELGYDSVVESTADKKNSSIIQFIQGIFSYDKQNKATQTQRDSILDTGEKLARAVVQSLLEDLHVPRDKLSICVRNCVIEMLNRHDILFTSMVNRLRITPDSAYETFFNVADQIFLNYEISWGRIIVLYAFAGRLALYCQQMDMAFLSKDIPLFVSRYIGKEVVPFVKRNGGWEAIMEEFPMHENMSDRVWRCLLVTGASLGLVATLLAIHS